VIGGTGQSLHGGFTEARGEPIDHLLELLGVLGRAREQVTLQHQGLQEFVGFDAEPVDRCAQRARGEPLAASASSCAASRPGRERPIVRRVAARR